MDARSWTPIQPLFFQQSMNADPFHCQPCAVADDELAPIYRRPRPQVSRFFDVGQTSLSLGGSPSTGQRRSNPWISDFNPFDYEVEMIASPSLNSIQSNAFFPKNTSQGQHYSIAATNADSRISMEILAATSSPTLSLVSNDVTKPITSVEKNSLVNPLLSLKDQRGPEKATLQTPRSGNKRTCPTNTITCEYPGCTVTFGRKKDRNRHFRLKHQANEGFRCPLVDCSVGTGHRIQRRDKLRDHLKKKGEASSLWQCVLPHCSTVVTSRSELIDHLGHHNRITRLAHQQLLIDYGFITGDLHPGSYYNKPPLGYLTCSFICDVRGCPFGTNCLETMNRHRAIPHEGSYCPCPMTDCKQILQDWASTSAHLAREHDAHDREAQDRELVSQGFWWRNSVFTCPICNVEIKILLNKVSCDEKIRDHFSTHDAEYLLFYRQEMVQAFASSNRRTLWHPRMPLLDSASDEQVFAYLTWPKERLLEIWNMVGSV